MEDKKIKKVQQYRTYITGNWDRIIDWRKCVQNPPEDARSLGAMKPHQRHIYYRMKKRGMHRSEDGAEAMLKVKQGMLNGTLRDVYLQDQKRTARKQHEVKKKARMTQNLHQPTRPSIGSKKGAIGVYVAHSSPIGKLAKSLRQ